MIDLKTIAGGGAIVAALTYAWGSIRAWLSQLLGFVVCHCPVQPFWMPILIAYMRSESSGYKFVLPVMSSFERSIAYLKRFGAYREVLIASDHSPSGVFVYRKGWRIMWVTKSGIGYIRGMVDPAAILSAAFNRHLDFLVANNDTYQQRFSVYRRYGMSRKAALAKGRVSEKAPTAAVSPGESTIEASPGVAIDVNARYFDYNRSVRLVGLDTSELGGYGLKTSKKRLDGLFYAEAIRTEIEYAKRWKASRDWFVSHDIPWQLAWLLHGKPGNGKTALCIAVAEHLNLPVYILDISSMSNDELACHWESAINNSPAMILLEDFSNCFNGRETKQEDGVTFDCLLNLLSGTNSSSGLFVVITTNDIACIPPELGAPVGESGSTRPGRIDRVILVGDPDAESRLGIAKKIVSDPRDAERLAIETDGNTAAQVQDTCLKFAMGKYWADVTAGKDATSTIST